jgi:hypothetical protein
MSTPSDPPGTNHRPAVARRRPRPGAAPSLGPEVFRDEFNETLAQVLDLETWRGAREPADEYRRIEREVRQAVEAETDYQKYVRREVHPLLVTAPGAPPGAGVHPIDPAEVISTQRGLLFNGAVECCDGTNQVHDTLALTIYQLGVSLVSYRGDEYSWQQRLFRRDLRLPAPDPVEAVAELLERRERRGGLSHPSPHDELSELARRGLTSYAERAVLANRARAPWRMGHGSPAPLELVGAKFTDLAIESIRAIRRLIDHGRFVFVASDPSERALLTIAQGLRPLEYAIVGTLKERIEEYLENWAPAHPATVDTAWEPGGGPLPPERWVRRFLDEVAPRVVYGLYRASDLAPPHLFYAHVDHAHVAARIAVADSALLEQRGTPLLIDLADRVCRSIYGGGSLREMAEAAYAAAGAPFRYQSERLTRPE